MPTIRAMSWNIKDFKGSAFTKHGNTILSKIYNGAVRQIDLLVIVEPFSKMKKFGLADLVTEGAGIDGVLELYFALAAKDLRWKVAPLRTTAMPPVSDMAAVFYHSGVVDLQGPDVLPGGVGALVTTVATPGGHTLPWSAASDRWPQVRFYLANGNEVNYHGRRPSLYHLSTPDQVERDFTLAVVAPAGGGAPTIVTDLVPDGAQGIPFEVQLQADGGTPGYTWAQVAPGTVLPAGVVFTPATGVLAGTPTANGAFSLEVELSDSGSPPATTTKTFPFNIAAPNAALGFDTAIALPRALQNAPYRVRLAGRGGTGARTVTFARKLLADALPAGLILGADGLLSGTPTTVAANTLPVHLAAEACQTRAFTMDVTAPGAGLAIFSAALPEGRLNAPYDFLIQSTGGTGAHVWTVNAGGTALPAGVVFDAATGRLHGTPTSHGAFTLDVTVTDALGNTANSAFALTIHPATTELGFTTAAALPAAALNRPYRYQLVGRGGSAGHAFQRFDDLPAGLSMSPEGLIEGTPTTAIVGHAASVQVLDTGRTFKLVALHAPPQARYPKNRDSVRALASMREITTLWGSMPVVVCGDFNICTFPAQDCGTHKAGEFTALTPLLGQGFTSQNGNSRSSCQSSANAQKAAYAELKASVANHVGLDQLAKHAFDHVLTRGFTAVNGTTTVNLVRDDPGYNAARTQAQGGAPSPIKGIVRKYIWSDGVSDHLPIRFDLVL